MKYNLCFVFFAVCLCIVSCSDTDVKQIGREDGLLLNRVDYCVVGLESTLSTGMIFDFSGEVNRFMLNASVPLSVFSGCTLLRYGVDGELVFAVENYIYKISRDIDGRVFIEDMVVLPGDVEAVGKNENDFLFLAILNGNAVLYKVDAKSFLLNFIYTDIDDIDTTRWKNVFVRNVDGRNYYYAITLEGVRAIGHSSWMDDQLIASGSVCFLGDMKSYVVTQEYVSGEKMSFFLSGDTVKLVEGVYGDVIYYNTALYSVSKEGCLVKIDLSVGWKIENLVNLNNYGSGTRNFKINNRGILSLVVGGELVSGFTKNSIFIYDTNRNTYQLKNISFPVLAWVPGGEEKVSGTVFRESDDK